MSMNKAILTLSVFLLAGVFVTGCEMTSSEMAPETEVMAVEVVAHYKDYSSATAEMIKGQKAVVFFYAEWCSTCRKWEKKIMAEVLPEGAMVLKAEYDEETELKKMYGVNKQSTAVFVNADGSFELMSDPGMDEVQNFFSAN